MTRQWLTLSNVLKTLRRIWENLQESLHTSSSWGNSSMRTIFYNFHQTPSHRAKTFCLFHTCPLRTFSCQLPKLCWETSCSFRRRRLDGLGLQSFTGCQTEMVRVEINSYEPGRILKLTITTIYIVSMCQSIINRICCNTIKLSHNLCPLQSFTSWYAKRTWTALERNKFALNSRVWRRNLRINSLSHPHLQNPKNYSISVSWSYG